MHLIVTTEGLGREPSTRRLLANLREADAKYRPFSPFAAWRDVEVDAEGWERLRAVVAGHKKSAASELERAQRLASRMAAVETGAIEGLYEADRGFTFTVAAEAVAWESALAARDARTQATIHSQLASYVMTPDGDVHAYAPSDVTAAEMQRLCDQIASEAFLDAHPVVQAAYVHHAFTAVHPFADGNGRVARALASVFTYRAAWIPLLIFSDQRREYFAALRAADAGRHQPFTSFVFERTIDALKLVDESFRTGAVPRAEASVESIGKLYTTPGGLTPEEVDAAGFALVELMSEELRRRASELTTDKTQIGVEAGAPRRSSGSAARRPPVAPGNAGVTVSADTVAPAEARILRSFVVEVPKDPSADGEVVLRDHQGSVDVFTARIEELTGKPSVVLVLRARMAADRILGEMLRKLADLARDSLRSKAY